MARCTHSGTDVTSSLGTVLQASREGPQPLLSLSCERWGWFKEEENSADISDPLAPQDKRKGKLSEMQTKATEHPEYRRHML